MPKASNKLVRHLILLVIVGACASAKPPPRPIDLPHSRIFVTTFEDVWSATVQVLDIYSIVEASRESGLLRTETSSFANNAGLYEHPDKDDRLDQVRYYLTIKLSKGLVSQTGKNAVRVQVTKVYEKYGNLLTDWERIPSDEHEERVILYRIGQRLRIGAAVKRRRAELEKKKASASSPIDEAPMDAPENY